MRSLHAHDEAEEPLVATHMLPMEVKSWRLRGDMLWEQHRNFEIAVNYPRQILRELEMQARPKR
jgi:hypothetical protein